MTLRVYRGYGFDSLFEILVSKITVYNWTSDEYGAQNHSLRNLALTFYPHWVFLIMYPESGDDIGAVGGFGLPFLP